MPGCVGHNVLLQSRLCIPLCLCGNSLLSWTDTLRSSQATFTDICNSSRLLDTKICLCPILWIDDLCLFMEPKCSLGRLKRVDKCTVLDGLGSYPL